MKIQWRISRSSRLIDALKERLDSSVSARSLKRALESNVCRVNRKVERFASAKVCVGDVIEWESSWQKQPSAVSLIYEDEQLLVVNKSAGMVCTDSEWHKILPAPAWLAHRLDKDTTGVLLFGKTQAIAKELQECFENRVVEKSYLAVVDGVIDQEQGVIENRLAKKKTFQGQTIWGATSSERGLYAKTAWTRLACDRDLSLLLCRPETGRTHQIRTHLAQIGHPILVDRQYAAHFRSNLFAARPLLHASQLKLEWRQRSFCFQAPLPEDFQTVMEERHFARDLIPV